MIGLVGDSENKEVWACHFLQISDLFFRPIFACFIIELASRTVVHVNVMRFGGGLWSSNQPALLTRWYLISAVS